MDNQFWLEFDKNWYRRLAMREDAHAKRLAAIFLAHSGDSWFWLLGLLIVWLSGNTHTKAWAFSVGAAILVLAVTVLVLKFSFRRARPEGTWGNVYRKSDPHSFPSGHAARATMLAVLAAGMGPWWLATILIPWAPLVSLARVSMGLHYPSDVIAGSTLGLVVGIVALLIF